MMAIAEREDPAAAPATTPLVGRFFEGDDEGVEVGTDGVEAGVDEGYHEQLAVRCCQTIRSLQRVGAEVEHETNHWHS